MPEYTTHVGLVLRWETGAKQRVTINGEREKVLYEGDDIKKAGETYSYAIRHYTQREAAAEFGAEAEVPYVRPPRED